MEHRIVRDEAGWLALEDDWRALLERAAEHSVFLTPEWMYAWWRHFGSRGGGQPRVVVSYSEGYLVGLLPLCVSGRRSHSADPPAGVLRFMGSTRVCSDHLDGLLEPGKRELVQSGWREALMTLTGECKALDLDSGLDGGELDAAWSQEWSAYPVDRRETEICPRIELPESFELFLGSLRTSVRKKILYFRRRLARQGEVNIRLIETPETVEAGFAVCVELHQLRRQSMGEAGSFADDRYLAFHREVSRSFAVRGWLRLLLLDLDERPVAARYEFAYRGRVFDYLPGHHPDLHRDSVGLVLLSHCVETAIERGDSELDLLRGDEAYKFRWASGTRPLWRRRGERFVSGPWFARRAEETIGSLKSVVRRLMPARVMKMLGKGG